MNDLDLDHNRSMSARSEPLTNQETEMPLVPRPPALDASSPESKSGLDQQVDAAVRDVETWLQSGVVNRSSEPDIDRNTPYPVQPSNDQTVDIADEHEHAFEDPAASVEEQKLRIEVSTAERQMLDVAKTRQQLQNRLLIKLEIEAKLQAEAFTRRREEEELRKQAEEEGARRRQEDEAKLEAQRKEIRRTQRELKVSWEEERRLRSEIVKLNHLAHEALLSRVREEENAKLALLMEAQRRRDEAEESHIDNLAKLHSEEESLRRAVASFGLRRTEVEAQRQKHEEESRKIEEERARLANSEAARLAERKRLREEAEFKLRRDQAGLATQESELKRLTETLAQQRLELEIAHRNAEEDAKRLADARARTQSAQEAAQRAERERLVLEAEIFERAESERHMLEATRTRAEEQQKQLEATAREREDWQASKVAELTSLRVEAEAKTQSHIEKEQALALELASLRESEQAILMRIKEVETQRMAATEAHTRLLEKLKRVEEEANARAGEEAQARTEIERRIKEETEQLRKLENEHRQRIESEIARRSEAERLLAAEKDRYQSARTARIDAELKVDVGAAPLVPEFEREDAADLEEVVTSSRPASIVSQVTDDATPVYQVGDLSNSDPRRRADAVTALAHLGTQDAYDLIASCFDDDSSLVRNAAARAMLMLEPVRPAESFTRALKDASPERRTRIGKAIAESGLATQALEGLASEDREETYNSLCLLFTMARTGEVEPIVSAIETHEDAEIRVAAVRLLKMSGQEELATAAVNRRLHPNG